MGIGRAVTIRLAKAGCKVAFSHYQEMAEATELEQALLASGATAYAFELDLSQETTLLTSLKAVREHLGEPLILVNNARVDPFRRPEHMTETAWWLHTYAVNVVGHHLLLQALWNPMIAAQFGRVVNLSSIHAFTASPAQLLPYGASKAAQLNLTRSYAALGAAHGVTVNTLAPGFVTTQRLNERLTPAEHRTALKRVPVGRGATPDEIADAVLFLLSAGFVTGSTLHLNGGELML